MIQLEPGEQIVKEVRKHWFAIIMEILGILFAGFIPAFIFLAFATTGINFLIEFPFGFIFYYSVWLLLLWIFFFIAWTNYHLDVLIITDMRIIDVEQHGLFSHDVAEVQYHNIQDVKIEVMGVLPSLFKFGTVHIQTAGSAKEFVMHTVPHPHSVKDAITTQQRKLHRISHI